MKKIIALLIAALFVFSLAACSEKADSDKKGDEKETVESKIEETEAPDAPVDGGWSETGSIAVTDEVKAMFDKLNETMTGAYYVPVAYLESQVVAGTNHLVLCKMIPSVGDALGTYVLVTVYEDLEGKAEITSVQESSAVAPEPYNPENPVAGGWAEPDTNEVTDEAKAALEKAAAQLDGADYEAVALLATQIVAGTNYQLLCKITPVVPNAGSTYSIVTVYEDLDGNAEITDTFGFGIDENELPEIEESADSQAE